MAPEPLASPVVVLVLLSQAPSRPVPSARAAKITEGFLVNIMVERLIGLVSYTAITQWVTSGKPVFL
jgi:hypothetical protein